MEIERRHAAVPDELVDYLRASQSASQGGNGHVHVHVHHHYAPAAPIPPEHIVHQGPQQSVAQKILPWLWTALLACVVLTLCAAVLATVLVVVVAVLAALVLLGLVVAYIINSQTGATEARARAAEAMRDSVDRRRKRR